MAIFPLELAHVLIFWATDTRGSYSIIYQLLDLGDSVKTKSIRFDSAYRPSYYSRFYIYCRFNQSISIVITVIY